MDEEGPQRLRHLHRHKAQDRKHGEKQQKAGPETVKTDPLISRFCRHLEIEEKNIRLVCTVKFLGQTLSNRGETERQR